MKRPWRRMFQGVLLALLVPTGWALILSLAGGWTLAQTRYHYWLFGYMLLGSALVFCCFGYLIGRNEERFSELSLNDFLTKLFNVRYFHERLLKEFANAKRYGSPLTLALLDLDHFKQVNDAYGHPAGDRVLKIVAQTVAQAVRQGDTVARVGGEEFGVIMPQTSTEQGLVLAERIRRAVKEREIPLPGRGVITIRVSLGVAGTDRVQAESASGLFAAADQALYAAKRSGRDRVVAAPVATI
jgi:diguanylate cyclase (GGDEF)-like protein